jgi:hypothetical protein
MPAETHTSSIQENEKKCVDISGVSEISRNFRNFRIQLIEYQPLESDLMLLGDKKGVLLFQ